MQPDIRVVAVVVAFNRAALLQECLDGLSSQTRPIDALIVINNASTDSTEEVAQQHAAVSEVVTLHTNTGGAGGFTAGIARAVNTWNADLVWIMDDDTVPTPTALEELLSTRTQYPGEPAVLASKAVWVDGAEHPMNRPRPRPLLSAKQKQHAQNIGTVPIRTASFVSILIDARAIAEVGLPEAGYFLWNDDFEYTSRLLKRNVGLYVPASVVVHKTATFGNSAANPGARFENEVRNKLWAFKYSLGLYPHEKILYGGKTALRWLKLLSTAPDRKELWGYACHAAQQATTPPPLATDLFTGTAVAEDVHKVAYPPTAAQGSSNANHRSTQEHATTHGTHTYSPTHIEPFSVLMSVYGGDNPDFFRTSLKSISVHQTLKPSQIVLVQDGPVSPELSELIENAALLTNIPTHVVHLTKNHGLAAALDIGLEYCENDIVARQDADDISLPQRFERQIPMMKSLDLLGSALTEFDQDPSQLGLLRMLPLTPHKIRETAALRDPFNHPTVVFRRSAVLEAGGYSGGEKMEDYWLFARMIQRGARVANLPDSLVLYRIGAGAYARRGGTEMAKIEIHMQQALHRIGITSTPQYLRNLAIRVPYRLIPAKVRETLFHSVGKALWFHHE